MCNSKSARVAQVVTVLIVLCACSKPEAPAADQGQQASAAKPEAPPAEPAPPPEAQKPSPPPLLDPADPDEACGQIVVVAFEGAKYAAPEIKRDKAAAQQRAAELLVSIQGGADFATVAEESSDAPSSAPRGGVMGTYRKDAWPELHAAMKEPLFGLKVHQVADKPVEAEYGYVLVRRCKVEKAHARHILIRYAGAARAEPSVQRDKEAAKALAEGLRTELEKGADFEQLAKQKSEDSSAERGGDLGLQGRGRLAVPFEQALFALEPDQLSAVVETKFGFHIIQRVAPK